MEGALTLGQVAERTAALEVARRYDAARLVARHGAGMPLPELRGVLAGDCPRRAAWNVYDLCDVHFPQLLGLFLRR